MSKKKRNDFTFLTLVLFFATFSLYSYLASSDVFGGDSGDLLSAIAVHGVAHPSGYPLFTILGIILSYLPIDAPLAWKVGVGSALYSSLALVFIYLLVMQQWKNRLYALITSFSLAFVFPFWLHAEITEVMSLQHFFIAAILYFVIRFKNEKKAKFLYITALIYGLSLTNNQTILLLLPVILLLSIGSIYASGRVFRYVLFSLIFFFLGLLPYLYIPIAASFSPPVNWNNATTLENFMRLVLRQDYGWGPSFINNDAIRHEVTNRYFSYLFSELTLFGVLVICTGLFWAFFRRKQLLPPFSYILGFVLFGPFFFYYGAGPAFEVFSDGSREKFFASSIIFLVLFIPYGIEALSFVSNKLLAKINVARERVIIYRKVIVYFFFIFPTLLFLKNIHVLNIRDSAGIAEVFAGELLVSLPKDTVLIAQRDNVLFPVRYVEYVNGFRSDVYATLPGELKSLAGRGMIRLGVNPTISVLSADADPDNDIHAIAMRLPTSVVISESDYHGFVKADTIVLIPHGLVLKYANESERTLTKAQFLKRQNALLAELSDPRDILSVEKKERLWLLRNIPLFYSHAYSNTGYFLMYAYKDYSLAREYFKKAIAIDNQDHWAFEGLGITYYQQKKYERARASFEKAVTVQPLNHNAYFLLYGTTIAMKDKEASRSLEEFFKQYNEIYTEFNFGKTRVRIPR